MAADTDTTPKPPPDWMTPGVWEARAGGGYQRTQTADAFLDSKEHTPMAPVVPMTADQFLDAPPAPAKQDEEEAPPDPGELRAPTADEEIAMKWEAMTGGLFSSGPRSRPAHEEGVKTEWSDLPHMVGGLVSEMALQPGNILSGITAAKFPVTAPFISRGYGGYMLAQSVRQAKGLYGELQNPDVTGAQKTFDTFAYTLQTVLGLALGKGPTKMKFETGISDLKSAHAAMPAEEANAFGQGDAWQDADRTCAIPAAERRRRPRRPSSRSF